MAQYLKDDVQQRVVDAALQIFARGGYRAATMAEIATMAGVSTGNVYRYFENKQALFRAAVPDTFARDLGGLVRRRVRALDGVGDLAALDAGAPYHLLSEELLAFCIAHRLRVVVLLGRAQDTAHERFAAKLIEDLVGLALAHAGSVERGFRPTETMRFALDRIYRSFVSTLVEILATFADEAQIREVVAGFSGYHLAGMKAVLFAWPTVRKR